MKTITTPRFSRALVAALALVATPAFASDAMPHPHHAATAEQSVDCGCHRGGHEGRASHAPCHKQATKAEPGAKGAAAGEQESDSAFVQQVWMAP